MEFEEKEHKEAVSGVVRTDTDYLLLQKNNGDGYDFWELPGGHLEDDETPLEGFLREFEEELGHDVESISELKGFRPYCIETSRKVYKVFPHEVKLDDRMDPELSDEHSDYCWLSRRMWIG